MKKTIASLAVFFCMVIIIPSCTKESHNDPSPSKVTNQIVNATIPSGQTYIFNPGSSESMTISRQACHYKVSEALNNSETGIINYKYTPVEGFTGLDEVTLNRTFITTTNEGSGCSNNNSSSSTSSLNTNIIVIKINVTN